MKFHFGTCYKKAICISNFALLVGQGVILGASVSNDLFENRTVVVGTEIQISGSNAKATVETREHLAEQGTGATVWWTWTSPVSARIRITTEGSELDTVMGIYTGQRLSRLTLVGVNDDEDSEAGIFTSSVEFFSEEGITYHIGVGGYQADPGQPAETGVIQLSIGPGTDVQAPSWSLTDTRGNLINSDELEGSVVILDFWTTTCAPCIQELPHFINLVNLYRDRGLVLIGLSRDSITHFEMNQFINELVSIIQLSSPIQGWKKISEESMPFRRP
ncbi:MAG TPA: TlpA family protein disulfide reductase [Verrucomicrobiales bacterium]|nr:TlpA family protein disulfide reductase [Verrucomicrobiales bacterium]